MRLGMNGAVTANKTDVPDAYFVDVTLTLTAALPSRAAFLAELTYRVEVELRAIPENSTEYVLVVDVPTAIFPIMQEILVRNGGYAGYPEMQIAPLDFRAIHLRNHPELALAAAYANASLAPG